jgi:hypothetical protein
MKKIILGVAVLLSVISLTSCDKDFNTIGSEIVGGDHFDFEKYDVQNITAFSKPTGAVQSNNLPINPLGIYQDPVFGDTKATFVSQLQLEISNPTIGTLVDIKAEDSVYLYVPYFSEVKTYASGNEANIYTLDSIYGDRANSMNLSIFESGYAIRNFDVNDPSITQKYYNDQKTSTVEANLIGSKLNNSANIDENLEFKFFDNEHVIYKTDGNGQFVNNDGDVVTDVADRVVKERIAPGMWINLDKNFFKTKVLEAGSSNLINNNVFRDHLRGLYFQVEQNSGQDGVLALLNFSNAYINIQYHSTVDAVEKKRNLKLKLSGNTISFLEYSNNSSYTSNLNMSNSTTGDEKLYLKGGQGSVAYIDLFGEDSDLNGISDELELLRSNNWLINDAYLTFYVDQATMSDADQIEPARIYIFDAENNRPLIDYYSDPSTSVNPKRNKSLHNGLLEVNTSKKGIKYKFKITSHINNLLTNEDVSLVKNVRLGISVTENINNVTIGNLKTPFQIIPSSDTEDKKNNLKFIPVSSILHPFGTVLYGNNVMPVDADKKIKLEIYYTKPN